MIIDNNAAISTPTGPGAPAGVPSPAEAAGPSTLRLLIVDDDPGILGIIAMALLGEGYRVTCAEDGERGWDQLCAASFDGLITDHAMPCLTGLELIRRVRARPSRLPVILISGAVPWEEADLDRLLTPGVAVDKPFVMREFLATVKDTFGGPSYSELRRGRGARSATRPSGGASAAGSPRGPLSRHTVR